MPKSFLQLLNEAPPAPPMMGGGLGGPGGPGPLGGPGMPGGGMPPPPMGGGGGLPPPPMGGGPGMDPMGGGQQPVPVKTIDAMDVWEVLKNAAKDMDKHEELNINYERRKKTKEEKAKVKSPKKKSALMT